MTPFLSIYIFYINRNFFLNYKYNSKNYYIKSNTTKIFLYYMYNNLYDMLKFSHIICLLAFKNIVKS